jgi:hypothetical protein
MNFKDGSESNEKDNQEIKEQITIWGNIDLWEIWESLTLISCDISTDLLKPCPLLA